MQDFFELSQGMLEEDRKKLGRDVHRSFEEDDDSRSDWLTMHARWLSLYYQNTKAQNPPWEGSSDEELPILAEACNQFHARAKKAMLASRKLFDAIPVGHIKSEDMARAKRVGDHLNWQLTVRNRRYKRDKNALLLSSALHGDCFTKVYPQLDPYRPLIKNVRAVDLVMAYGVGPRAIEDIDRKTEIVHTTVARTEIMAQQRWLSKPASPYTDRESDPVTEAHDLAQGVEDQHLSKERTLNACLLEQHTLLNLDGIGLKPYIVTIDRQTKEVLRVAPRFEIKHGNVEAIEYYTAFPFLPNPDGSYGLGMGHLVAKINMAVNKLLRMTVDAGELATAGNMSGFITDFLGMPGDTFELSLGHFRKVRPTSQNINDGIFQFKFPGPSNVLPEIIGLLTQRADRLATVTEALTGQLDKVVQPTALLALIDQGLQMFSGIIGDMLESQSDEAMKIYRLNRLYMPEEEYFAVQDIDGTPRQAQIGKSDYADDLQIVAIADPAQVSEQQRLTRAEIEYRTVLENPLLMQNPVSIHTATRRYFEAVGIQNIEEILPPLPGQPPRQDDPRRENFGALLPNPVIPPVFVDQDHLFHLASHEAFLNDIYAKQAPPTGLQALAQHIQMHRAFAYMVAETDMMGDLDGEAIEIRLGAMAPPAGLGMAGGQAGPGQNGGAGGPQAGGQPQSPVPGAGGPAPPGPN